MIPSPRIGAIFFYVSDIDRTERFYREVIGLEVQRILEEDDGFTWLNASIPGNVDLLFFPGEVQPGNSPMVVFELPDGGIDKVVGELAEAGTTIVTPVSHAPGGWSADFSDPDGYLLSLYQSAKQPR